MEVDESVEAQPVELGAARGREEGESGWRRKRLVGELLAAALRVEEGIDRRCRMCLWLRERGS